MISFFLLSGKTTRKIFLHVHPLSQCVKCSFELNVLNVIKSLIMEVPTIKKPVN